MKHYIANFIIKTIISVIAATLAFFSDKNTGWERTFMIMGCFICFQLAEIVYCIEKGND